jgi:hypothetical protein
MDEHSIILLSNSSTDFYNNKLSEFTNNMNPPLNLSPLGKWKVALTEIRHNNLLDYIYVSAEKDNIIFDNWFSNTTQSLQKFANNVWYSAKNPLIYNYTYFQDFLDPKKLENYPDEKCFKEYEITENEIKSETNSFNVNVQFEKHFNIDKGKTITFKTSHPYTGKQIFHKVMQACFEIISNIDNLYTTLPFILSKGHALSIIATHFIDQIRYGVHTSRKSRLHQFESLGSFVYIYSDIIQN